MPDGFGTGLGAFGGGLGRGFAGGLRLGAEMSFRKRQEQRLAESQRRLEGLAQTRTLVEILGQMKETEDPALRKFLSRIAISAMGLDPKSEEAKTLGELFKGAQPATLDQFSSSISSLATRAGVDPTMYRSILQATPRTKRAEMMLKIVQGLQMQAAQGGPTPAAPAPP
ncbi:MAG: hypothetical protein ACE5JS_21695, partial [Nitrospinota bacterium]